MYLTSNEAKQAILLAGDRLYQRGFVAANDGNISARMADGSIWATPTGVSKAGMTPDMLVRLSPEGVILEGDRRVSSEIALHLAVYREDPALGGVVHAHSPWATAWAAYGLPFDRAVCLDAALNLGVVPCAPYAPTGSVALAASAAPYVRGHTALLLEHHGAVTWGRDVEQALFRTESLEHSLQIYANQLAFGRVRLLSEAQLDDIQQIKAKYGIVNPRATGQAKEEPYG